MKKIIGFTACVMLLVGCHTTNTGSSPAPHVGMANPASVYCVEQGGKLEIRNETQGQVGYCQLANGELVEEWALFRANQKLCLAEQAQQLIGQKLMSEDKIKAQTQAEIVRVVGPNQPVTLDYRDNRVTLLVNPATQVIERASCG